MQQLNSTTFQAPELGDIKPKVIVGGSPVDKFIPNVNISFHEDEFFINLNRRDKQAKTGTAQTAELDGIDKDIFYIDENGRFKWDIEFKERPACNSWAWELKHSEGIEFFYQGELTPEEIVDGSERPIEVVGSYAVYCNQKNNKYKTGKLCHIYRPFCYDINAESIYADLKIADGKLTITIDETWLNNAAYPVRLDPTIGYATKGASYENMNNNSIWAPGSTTIEDGEAQSLSLYAYITSAVHFCAALYNGSSLVSGTAEGYESSYDGWKELALNSASAITASTDYYLALRGENSNIRVYYDYVSGSLYRYNNPGSYSSTWSDPITWNSAGGYRFSIYCTYTTSSDSALPAFLLEGQLNGGLLN